MAFRLLLKYNPKGSEPEWATKHSHHSIRHSVKGIYSCKGYIPTNFGHPVAGLPRYVEYIICEGYT